MLRSKPALAARDLFHSLAEGLNFVSTIQHADLDIVGAPLAGLQHDQLTGLAHRITAESIGAWLDADGVLALGHHAPFDVLWHLRAGVDDVQRLAVVPQARVNNGDRHTVVGIRSHGVLKGLLQPVPLWLDEARVFFRPARIGVAEQHARLIREGREQLGAGIYKGKAGIDVVKQHVLGRQVARVLDLDHA